MPLHSSVRPDGLAARSKLDGFAPIEFGERFRREAVKATFRRVPLDLPVPRVPAAFQKPRTKRRELFRRQRLDLTLDRFDLRHDQRNDTDPGVIPSPKGPELPGADPHADKYSSRAAASAEARPVQRRVSRLPVPRTVLVALHVRPCGPLFLPRSLRLALRYSEPSWDASCRTSLRTTAR
jgi:hypothetical protein